MRPKAKNKANEDITTSVSEALSQGLISTEGVVGILENVAKHHKLPLPTSIGFNPATCTVEDCRLLAETMFNHGKYAEMVSLRNRLDKMVSTLEKAREVMTSSAPALRAIG